MQAAKTKPARGGARPGAGAKSKTPSGPLVSICIRVPLKHIKALRAVARSKRTTRSTMLRDCIESLIARA